MTERSAKENQAAQAHFDDYVRKPPAQRGAWFATDAVARERSLRGSTLDSDGRAATIA